MIAIYADNTAFYISPDTKIRMEFNSPVWEDNVIRGSYSFPFELPPVDVNVKLMGFSNFVLTKTGYKLYPVRVCLLGKRWLKANLLEIRSSAAGFSVSLLFSPFASDFADKLITAFAWPAIETGNIRSFAKAAQNQRYPQAVCQFPSMAAPNFYGEANKDFIGILNKTNAWAEYQFNAFTPDDSYPFEEESFASNQHALMPCFYLKYVLKNLFTSANYRLTGSLMDDDRLHELILVGNHPSDKKVRVQYLHSRLTNQVQVQAGYRYHILYNDTIENTGNVKAEQTVPGSGSELCTVFTYPTKGIIRSVLRVKVRNDWNKECFVQCAPNDESGSPVLGAGETEEFFFYFEDFQPGRSVGDPFYSVISLFDPTDGPVGHVEPFTLIEAEWKIQNLTENNLNRFEDTIRPENHLPQLSVSAFLNALSTAFCASLWLEENQRIAQFAFRKEVLTADFVDLTTYFEPDPELEPVKPEAHQFRFAWQEEVYTELTGKNRKEVDYAFQIGKPDTVNDEMVVRSTRQRFVAVLDTTTDSLKWEAKGYDFPPLQIGSQLSEPLKIEPALEPVLMAWADSENANLPILKDEADSSSFNLSNPNSTLRLAYYAGLQLRHLDGELEYFPSADSLINVPLTYETQSGLFPEYWKDWLVFYRNHKTATFRSQRPDLPVDELLKLFIAQEGKQVRRIRLGSTNFVPKQASIVIGTSGVEEAELKLAY